MNRDNMFTATLVALGLGTLSLSATAATGSAEFTLDPLSSRISMDYSATVYMTISGGGVSSSDSFVLHRHISESASGSLSASANSSGLTIDGGTIDASYTGTPLLGNLSFFGGLMTMDFEVVPKSWSLTLPSFDAGTPGGGAPGTQVFGPQQVDFSLTDDADFRMTLRADGQAPETITDSGASSYAFTGGVDSVISLGPLGDASGLLLSTPGPFNDSFSDSVSEYDPSVGLITLAYSGTETWSNLQVELTPVPLPAGAWVFGSALVGLLGFSRRRDGGSRSLEN